MTDDRHCDVHSDRPAIAVCTRCDADICGACHNTDMRGFAVCDECVDETRSAEAIPWETPSESSGQAFLMTLWMAMRHPRNFFLHLPEGGRVLPALLFGLICHLLGTVMATSWRFLLEEGIDAALLEAMGAADVPMPLLRAFVFTAIPVVVIFSLAAHIAILHAAIWLGGGDASPRLRTTARIGGYAAAPHILLFLPPIGDFLLGHLLMVIWMLNMEFTGLQRFYGMSPIRAMLVASGAFIVSTLLTGGMT